MGWGPRIRAMLCRAGVERYMLRLAHELTMTTIALTKQAHIAASTFAFRHASAAPYTRDLCLRPASCTLTIVLRAAIMLTLLNETTARPSAAFSQGTAAGRESSTDTTSILRQVSRAQVLPATRRAILTPRPRSLIFGHGHRIAAGHFTAIIVWC